MQYKNEFKALVYLISENKLTDQVLNSCTYSYLFLIYYV